MRSAVCFLVLCLAAEPVFAQAAAPPNPITLPPSSPLALSPPLSGEKSPERIAEIKGRVAFWLKTCLEDWDAADPYDAEGMANHLRTGGGRARTIPTHKPGLFFDGEPSALTALTDSHIATAVHDPKLLPRPPLFFAWLSSRR